MKDPSAGAAPSLLVASNRGPISFRAADDGSLSASRGGGGLVSGLSALDHDAAVLWVCAALTDADRRAARDAPEGRLDLAGHDTGGHAVQMLGIDSGTLHRAYNQIANSTLWFVHHMLFDTPTTPRFDAVFRREWGSYVEYNRAFAEALAQDAAEGAKVLVQDYHLTLAPRLLRDLRPDLRIAHFSHTPWAPVDYFAMLPDDVAREVVSGVLGADHIGFHSPRWAQAFVDCCSRLLGAEVNGLAVRYCGRTSHAAVHPLGVDGDALRARADAPDVGGRLTALRDLVGGRKLLARVDRTELSKNIVRGLHAYREMLRRYPRWHGTVTHVVLAYPSRHDLPVYREYTAALQRLAVEINEEFATPDWQPLDLRVDDDYARSLATYRLADVFLVNPVRDGMNLVAKEVPVVSDDGCALVLSREAGVADVFSSDAFVVNPYDISGTADALDAALSLDETERRACTRRMAHTATADPPQRWFTAQIAALG
jgi:trehalose 6-phosphate synthase